MFGRCGGGRLGMLRLRVRERRDCGPTCRRQTLGWISNEIWCVRLKSDDRK
jgi:hypothetical protein